MNHKPPSLLLIAGLQKSGTSLLLRLLQETGIADSPFTGVEGHDFWGNVPSHAPREFPAGTIYASHGGELGHELNAEHADEHVRNVLHQRLSALTIRAPLLVNKNPYHTVRLPWLKAAFPDSFIVATVRHAVPNVYSLLKKHRRPDELDRPWREDGWYGVKPQGWRTMLDEDLTAQCANQWQAVMDKLWRDRSYVDLFVGYRQLCSDPRAVLKRLLAGTGGMELPDSIALPPLRCYDDEYRHGAPFRSRNEVPVLAPTGPDSIEMQPLPAEAVARVQAHCEKTERCFEVLRNSVSYGVSRC